MYQVLKPARSAFVPIRTIDYHLLTWGEPQAGQAPLVMMHGWMDVAASFQFVVDALKTNRQVIAADWRGYGLTGRNPTGSASRYHPQTDNYWFADYMADLDFLLDHISPDAPVDLLGHSMGGNVVMLYAGARPQRIRRLINLEGFGMPATQPAQAPGRYAKWMDELKAFHQGSKDLRTYPDAAGVAQRLMKTNPRLRQDQADWLALHWAAPVADGPAQGRWEILGDAAHKIINAHLYQVPEALALYARITAPVLAVQASDNELEKWWQGRYSLAEYHERLKALPQVQIAHIPNAGHMLHHDQPVLLAQLIEAFLG